MSTRRAFITLLGGAAAAWPLAARGQPKLPTIGFLVATEPAVFGQRLPAFVQRLRELGWIEGRTIVIDYRWAEGSTERAAEIAAEFVRRKVDVIVTSATGPVLAAKQATSVIPIVFTNANDPVNTRCACCGRPPMTEADADRLARWRRATWSTALVYLIREPVCDGRAEKRGCGVVGVQACKHQVDSIGPEIPRLLGAPVLRFRIPLPPP